MLLFSAFCVSLQRDGFFDSSFASFIFIRLFQACLFFSFSLTIFLLGHFMIFCLVLLLCKVCIP